MELDELREQIDRIDAEIVKLFEERMAVAEDVAEYKLETGRSVLDRDREEQKLEKVRSMTQNPANIIGVTELFRQLMAVSRKRQYSLMHEKGISGRPPFIPVDSLDAEGSRVVFQGVRGAYSEEAALTYFGQDSSPRPVRTFKDAMRSIDEGSADFAVLPIENSSAGIVSANYDLLMEFENYIVAEQVIPIDHCLLGVDGASLDTVRTVYSHPQALMQCAPFLEERPFWNQVSLSNTAMAAKKVEEEQDISGAAIAGHRAADLYGLRILADHISADDTNSTRFIIVTNQRIFRKDAGKISVCFELPHRTGSLFHSLSHFIYNDLNMTKIESRPLPERPWEYRFFLDFDGNLNEAPVRNALSGLRAETKYMRILGNY
ncbi:MAG: prephenate dehydratase [Lachnospiraceae bacterium]|nr:prephenate dehydratase [Lachnospiraceae bacterium]